MAQSESHESNPSTHRYPASARVGATCTGGSA
jgi:hypothetical protein